MAQNLPFGIYNLLLPLDGHFSVGFFDRGEVSVEPVVARLEVARLWIRRIDKNVIDVFVEVADAIPYLVLLIYVHLLAWILADLVVHLKNNKD